MSVGPLAASPFAELRQHRGAVLGARFTKTGSYCISVSQDQSAVLWNPLKNLFIKEYKGPHNHEICSVAIADDNSKFITAGGDRFCFLFDVTTGNVIRKFGPHDGKVNDVVLGGANEALVLTGSYDKLTRVWDLREAPRRPPIQVLDDARDSVSSIAITQDLKILTTSVDATLRTYDLRAGKMHSDKLSGPAVKLGLSLDNRSCVLVNCLGGGGGGSFVNFLEIESGHHLALFEGHRNSHYSLNSVFDPSAKFVVGGSEDGAILVWDICPSEASALGVPVQRVGTRPENSQKVLKKELNAGDCVYHVAFHPSEPILLSCHNDRSLKLWKFSL